MAFKKTRINKTVWLVIVFALLAGCASPAETVPTEMPPAEMAAASDTPVPPTPTEEILPTETPTPSQVPTETPIPLFDGDTMVSEIDGMTLVHVSAGEFEMGTDDGLDDESPVHTVFLDAFWIDQTEVTNAMYALCVKAGVCSEPAIPDNFLKQNYADHPVVYVTWVDADTYCTWAGRRLPTEAEWEKAARGTDGRTFPWGEKAHPGLLNYGQNVGTTTPVGSYPEGASPYGALDMAGNVKEWVADWFGEEYYQISPLENPAGPESGEYRVSRGGSYLFFDNWVRTTARYYSFPFAFSKSNGFRCAADVGQP